MADDIKILDHLNIDLDGDGIAERYEIGGMSELPIASVETLGGIKIGENLTITEDGTLNAEASGTSVLSPGAILYDTEEKIVGKWINGKPLYQKVIPFTTTLQNNVWIETPELIDDKERIIQTFVIANLLYMPIMGNVDRDGSNYVRIWSMRSTICDITHVVIQYTKTTDEENSFTPDMIENISIMRNLDFSNIYTEEERIIGCWVDGRPIYQKYIDIGDISGSELNNYDVSSLNINFLVYADVNYYQTNVNNTELWYSASSGADSRVLGISSDHTKLLCWGTHSAFRYTKLILRYTKTTDAENSFTADMLTDHENITDAEIADAAAADKI